MLTLGPGVLPTLFQSFSISHVREPCPYQVSLRFLVIWFSRKLVPAIPKNYIEMLFVHIPYCTGMIEFFYIPGRWKSQ